MIHTVYLNKIDLMIEVNNINKISKIIPVIFLYVGYNKNCKNSNIIRYHSWYVI